MFRRRMLGDVQQILTVGSIMGAVATATLAPPTSVFAHPISDPCRPAPCHQSLPCSAPACLPRTLKRTVVAPPLPRTIAHHQADISGKAQEVDLPRFEVLRLHMQLCALKHRSVYILHR